MSKDDMEKILDKTDKQKKKKKKKGKRKIWKIVLLTILWGIIIAIGLGVGVVYSIFEGAGELPLEKFEINNFTTIIYDKDGNEYARLDTKENRIYVGLDEMSKYLPKAFMAIEDERFEEHFGVDVKRTGAATINWITTGNSDFGGSTITQQLIKKVTNDQGRSWQRKVREIVRAIQLEQKMSKNQIIELYMNIIFLGENSYGVETAAHTYFNKTAAELTIAECAMIGGLAQAPSSVNPFSNYEKAKARQELVLTKMHELGYITTEEYNTAMAEELVVNKGTSKTGSSNSYFVDAVVNAVIEDIHEQYGVDKGEAQRMVYSNGYSIYTTVDPKIQSDIESVYKDQSYFKLKNGTYDPEIQSAMVIIDYKKGNVVGMVGGAGEKTLQRGLNRATQTKRPPGSTMKPLGVYGPALEAGVITAASTFDEVSTTFKIAGSKDWTPGNNGKYRGLTSVRTAIKVSSNVVAAKVFNEIGASASRNFLLKLGVTSLTSSDVGAASLALGGLTVGLSPYEHAAAYGTFANGGIYMEPKVYTKVVDREGSAVLEKISDVRSVMSKQNAYLLTNMLQSVVSSGTGTEAALKNMKVAGKTGTTNESKDRWFAGYTPYYVASVWVGYDEQKNVSMSGNPAAKLWKAVMSKVHEGLENKDFEKPSGIVSVEVCKDSGMIPTELCKKDSRGSRVASEYFTKGTEPVDECTMHVEVQVCPDTLMLMNPTCHTKTSAINVVRLNKTYEAVPNPKPEDYDFIIPTEYCAFHEALKDENGNWIINTPTTPTYSGDISTSVSGEDDDSGLYDENGMPTWLGNGKR